MAIPMFTPGGNRAPYRGVPDTRKFYRMVRANAGGWMPYGDVSEVPAKVAKETATETPAAPATPSIVKQAPPVNPIPSSVLAEREARMRDTPNQGGTITTGRRTYEYAPSPLGQRGALRIAGGEPANEYRQAIEMAKITPVEMARPPVASVAQVPNSPVPPSAQLAPPTVAAPAAPSAAVMPTTSAAIVNETVSPVAGVNEAMNAATSALPPVGESGLRQAPSPQLKRAMEDQLRGGRLGIPKANPWTSNGGKPTTGFDSWRNSRRVFSAYA